MNLPLDIIDKVTKTPVSFINTRIPLNLPCYQENFPFRTKQKEAIELGLSNFPLVIIAGNPASGKTEIAKAILNTAIKNQNSTLIISSHQSSLNQYQNLSLKSLQINNKSEYYQTVKNWLKSKIQNPEINFTPTYLLPDTLLDNLQTNTQKLLGLVAEGNKEKLKEEIKKIFPHVSDNRRILLMTKIERFSNLLSQREYLKQNYQNIGEKDLEELTQLTIHSVNFPQTCLVNDMELVSEKTFDMVIVEDSHLLTQTIIEKITHYSQKLILLGELDNDNFFRRLFNNLSPAYRIEIKENHRLTIDLARKSFPLFYNDYPYTPTSNSYPLKNSTSESSFIWRDIVNHQQMILILKQYLLQNQEYKILTFSEKTFIVIQQQLDSSLNRQITTSINDWHGEEAENLLIILDKNNKDKPTLRELKLAFTRAKYSLTILGDKTYYENSSLRILFEQNTITIKRDLALT
ncbi:MAG: DEAD/DEAH box helicase family protein [Cyanobacterium sp.]